MYKNILVAIDLNDEASCHKPLLSAAELARTFRARLHVLTVVREVEAILQAKTATLGYEVIVADLESRVAALIRRVNSSDLDPSVLVAHGTSIYTEILGVAEEAGADLVVVGSHRPAIKDYLLGTCGNNLVRIPLDMIRPGDRLLVRTGEAIPTDGAVSSGTAVLDESALSGEPQLVQRASGELAHSGT